MEKNIDRYILLMKMQVKIWKMPCSMIKKGGKSEHLFVADKHFLKKLAIF